MKEDEVIKIVDDFTEKLYSHQYFIGRKEAKEDLGVKSVVYADAAITKTMADLFEEYKKEMELGVLWSAENELGPNNMQGRKDYKIAVIESAAAENFYNLSLEFRKQQVNITQQTPQGPIQITQEQVGIRVIGQGWK